MDTKGRGRYTLKPSSLIAKLKGIRHLEWIVLLILIGIAGSLLLPSGEIPTQKAELTALESRLARVLSAVEGAGSVEVIIHMDQETVAPAGAFTVGTGTQTEAKPNGVIVVADGASELHVRISLARAVQTLLDLPASAVEVLPREKVK